MRINRSIGPGERQRGEGFPEIPGSGRCAGGECDTQSGKKRPRSSLKGKDGAFAFVQRETEIFGVTYVMMHMREGGAMGPEMPLWKEN